MSLSKQHKSQRVNNKALPALQRVDALRGRCRELTAAGTKV